MWIERTGECSGEIVPGEVVPTKVGYERWLNCMMGEENPLVLLEEKHIGALIGNVTGLQLRILAVGTGRHAIRLRLQQAQKSLPSISLKDA